MQKIFIMLSLVISSVGLKGQDYSLTFEEVDSLMQVKAKPMVVFLHADWCKYCQAMKKTTFQDEEVKKVLQEDFYFVSFNGEHKEDVRFRGRTFRYQPTGYQTGEHQLARALGDRGGELSYPTVVVISEKNEIMSTQNQFISGKKLNKLLKLHLK